MALTRCPLLQVTDDLHSPQKDTLRLQLKMKLLSLLFKSALLTDICMNGNSKNLTYSPVLNLICQTST